jgi:hypothetical protein
MIEALWAASFSTQHAVFASGVVVFEGGRIFGGDGNYYYLGDYVVAGTTVSGKVEVTHYAGPPNSVLGPNHKLTLEFKGQITGNTMHGDGVTVSKPQMPLTISCRRLENLSIGAAIFAQYKNSVDTLLAGTAEIASNLLPQAYERLAAGAARRPSAMP